MRNLTERQQQIFEYICSNLQCGISPSVREICTATGLKSTATVHTHLKALEEKGLIIRNQGSNRSIRLSNDSTAVIPIMGRVTAGMPILAVEDIQGYVPVSDRIRRGRELFALRVVGESMINAGILDDDIVIVHKTPVADNGQIVVAMVDDEATVKRFYKENGHFRLQPENDSFDPIIVDECVILGQVISVVRYY
ncbi:MAG: transcriptional repressor LexA [Clostridia bacterium]|nr:transcriptional repressor LexA [Clostridia bacterium]MEE1124934.1 transcriptional repressor LexA [Acutalibacteraceae bacterium]